jgi:hypothetical protein
MLITKDGRTYKAFGICRMDGEWWGAARTFYGSPSSVPETMGPHATQQEAIEACEGKARTLVRLGWRASSLEILRAAIGIKDFDPYAGLLPLPSETGAVIEQERKAAALRAALEEKRRLAHPERQAAEADAALAKAEEAKVNAVAAKEAALASAIRAADEKNEALAPKSTMEAALYDMARSSIANSTKCQSCGGTLRRGYCSKCGRARDQAPPPPPPPPPKPVEPADPNIDPDVVTRFRNLELD